MLDTFNRSKCSLEDCGCKINSFVHISEIKKIIYFETPKCCSTSLKEMFGINVNYNFLLNYLNLKKNSQDNLDYSLLRKQFQKKIKLNNFTVNNINSEFKTIYNRAIIKNFLDKGFRSFAVIRNPLTKFISNYRMFCFGSEFRKKQFILITKNKFKDISKISYKEFLSLTKYYHNHHWACFSSFLKKDIIHNIFDLEDEDFHDKISNFLKQDMIKKNSTDKIILDKKDYEFLFNNLNDQLKFYNFLKN